MAACGPQPAASPSSAPRMYRLGLLLDGRITPAGNAAPATRQAFKERLAELGYVEGQNLSVEERIATRDFSQFDEEAGKLVRLPADVIVTNGSEWVRAVQAASWTVPIVIMG